MLVIMGSPLFAAGQNCLMFTYSDQWVDDSGNFVALNSTYADGDLACGGYSSYADVQLVMPSGNLQYASSVQFGDVAEAIAFAPAVGEDGTGSITGGNQLDYNDCGISLFDSLDLPLFLAPAVTISQTATQDPGSGTDCGPGGPCTNPAKCNQADWCTQDTSPPTCSVTGRKITHGGNICPLAYETPFVVYKLFLFGGWHCTQLGIHLSVPYFGPVPGKCTKLP